MTLGQQKLQQYFDDRPTLLQSQFAIIVGYAPSYINAVLKGHKPPAAKCAARLHVITGIDPTFWYQEAQPDNKEQADAK